MSSKLRLLSLLLVVIALAACGDDGPGTLTETEPSTGSTSTAIDVDPDAPPVQVYDSCAWGIGLLLGEDLYLLDGDLHDIEHPGSGMWARSDFPDGWDVMVWNGTPADGDDWVIRNAVAHRLDATTLDVRHAATGDQIGVFVLDPTPAEQRPACG